MSHLANYLDATDRSNIQRSARMNKENSMNESSMNRRDALKGAAAVTTPNAEAVGLYGLLGKNTGDIS